MIYREYGTTGEKLSAIGFGGMRFPNSEDLEASAEIVLAAFEAGVNYFDTAPGYCGDRSEIIVGRAVKEMKRRGGKFYVSTKSMKSEPAELRAELETSLKRLNVEAIDFYHCWCVMTMEAWAGRKSGGAVKEMLKAREEGLIRHACISGHLSGEEFAEVLGEGFFEGVTLGYSALNSPYRAAGIEAARGRDLGVVIMNPLGGGLIPKHPDRFGFIRHPEDPSLVAGALRFVLSTPGVTVALVGMDSPEHAREAAAVGDSFTPMSGRDLDAVARSVEEKFDKLCTLCRYCEVCPEGIPVHKYMSAYNSKALEDEKAMKGQIEWHWGIEAQALKLGETCTQCGACQEHCTQHLPIVERLGEIAAAYKPEK